MKKEQKPAEPPRWAQQLLHWYCRSELVEDLEGDLNEYFERNLTEKGPRRARLIYVLDVLKFFRPYTLRKPRFLTLFVHWLMIGSYIKTTRRSLVRNKLFSTINIVGLAVSMSVGLLVIAFLTDLRSYDDFHAKKDRIYRVITTDQAAGQRVMNFASTSLKAGQRIRATIPGLEDLTLLRNGFGGDATVGETVVPLSGLWADESFFRIFSFPMVQGNPATALREPNSVVLTEKTALKLFGETDVLGKLVRMDTTTFKVTGVVQDVPKLSHIQFDALGAFSTLNGQRTDSDGELMDWKSIYVNYVYFTLPPNGHPETIQAGLDRLSVTENAALKYRTITLSLQPLKDISMGKHLSNAIGPTIPAVVGWVLIGLALVIIISACFNYTNLSIARSLRRSREVGIRKVVGALRSHVMGQFLVESVLLALVSLGFAFGLFLFLREQFLALDPFLEERLSLELSGRLVLYFVGLAGVVGLAAGFVPPLFFARINAIRVLKGVSSLQLFRRVNMRRALIVVQYVFSLIFITTTIIGYNQYKSFIAFDLGFTTENVLNISLQNNKGAVLRKELAPIPGVTAIATSRVVMSLGSLYGTSMKYSNPQDSAQVWLNMVDEQYLPMHRHRFLAGTNFRQRPSQGNESEVIVNEQLLKRFNIAGRNPARALGEVVTMDGKKLAIVGVVKDFHYGTLSNKIEPMAFRYSTDERYLNLKIQSADLPATMAAIESTWKKIDRVHPLNAKFYDDQLERAYGQFAVMVKVIGFITFLAICIASMGLFGMVVFTTETRLKEISIRKVMGASESGLIFLLSRSFLVLLGIATLLALPITYVFFSQVVLIHFAYHQPVGLGELLSGAALILGIAFLMIGSQTLKAARSNPATVLKNE